MEAWGGDDFRFVAGFSAGFSFGGGRRGAGGVGE